MKTYLNDKYWLDEDKLGLTLEYLKSLGIIWNFIPQVNKSLVLGTRFANIESSKCLGPLWSPINAKEIKWNLSILLSPDTIDENTEILYVVKR